MKKTGTTPPFTDAELRAYLARRRVLVVSALNAGRVMRKFIIQFGAKTENVVAVTSFDDATKELEKAPVHILIIELSIDGRLQLMPLQEARFPNRLEIATMIVTSDPSSASTGMIAETNTDSVLVKPFNFDSFETAFHQAVANKVNPSVYWKLLESGKEHLKAGRFSEAEPLFEQSKLHHPCPTLSWYYLGEIQRRQNLRSQAITSYESGLELDAKDYRCLYGLFDAHLENRDFVSAYSIAERIHQNYPVSSTRILDLVKISVYTKKFTDIIDYCEIFRHIQQRDEVMNRVVVAGLLVCAKYFHLKNQEDKCQEALREASKISKETGTLILDVFRYLIDTGNHYDAEVFLAEIPSEVRKTLECRLLNLELLFATGNHGEVVSEGGSLIHAPDLPSPRVFDLLIESSIELGRADAVIQKLCDEKIARFPDSANSASPRVA